MGTNSLVAKSEQARSALGAYYEIVGYSKTFEVSQSKKYKNLTWFPSPNKYDSGGMLETLAEDSGLAYIGVWYLLAQLASTMPTRGLFVSDSGKPLTLKRIAVTLRIDIAFLKESFEHFQSIGWLSTTNTLLEYSEPARSELVVREDKIRIDKNKRVLSENGVSKPSKKTLEKRKEDFKEEIVGYHPKYEKELLNEFYSYWSEHGNDDTKMRKEKEKSFSVNRRLGTWSKNQKDFTPNGQKKERVINWGLGA